MKVSFTQPRKDGFNASHRRNNGLAKGYKAVHVDANGVIREVLELRIYETAATTYAAMWVKCGNFQSGTGKAAGGGYHKASAAAETAFRAAGYSFANHWGGSGDEAIREAIKAVCKFHGIESVTIIEMHP